jgi:phosphomannomutase
LVGNELQCLIFNEIVPTPLLAFAVTELGCDGGVMITASHNPKHDNGYKIYSQNGCQIISPTDKNITVIMKEIVKGRREEDIKIGNLQSTVSIKAKDLYSAYLKHLPQLNSLRLPEVVYTPVHGVGWRYIHEMCPSFIPTLEQMNPDPDFPTVKFPNPEEGKDTLNLAIQRAENSNTLIIMANDPDVDRFALAEKSKKGGQWKVFTGNEIAAIFAHFLWNEYKESNRDPKQCYILTTCVSSQLVKRMAKIEGFNVEATFTGFKNIGNLANSLYEQGKTVIFAFEEAIGFMIGKIAWEKDGISSVNLACRIANLIYTQREKQFKDYLEEIYNKYGWCYQKNSYYHLPENSGGVGETIFGSLREKLKVKLVIIFRIQI